MKSVVGIQARNEANSGCQGSDFAAVIGQLRLAILAGVDEEFLGCEDVASLEVTAAQFAILRTLLRGSGQSACELCKTLDYDRGAMSRMIDRLETKRLIRRVPLAHTRRTVALEVTPAGKAAFPKMEACLDRVMARIFAGIPKAQLRDAEKVLQRMLANS